MTEQELTARIVEMLADITGEDEVGDYPDVDLFEEEVLDSLGAIEFLVALKDAFGVSIAPTELERDEMNTVSKIVARVAERL